MPVFERPKITEMAYRGIQRNIKEFAEHGYSVEVFIAGSEEVHEKLAERYGWNYKYVKNGNLGEKNQGLYKWMKEFEWDFMLQLGSDDIILPGGVDCLVQHMAEYEFACFTEIYFFRATTGEGTLHPSYACGAGRYVSRRICNAIEILWPFAHIGNDGRSADRIYRQWKIEPYKMKGAFIADIKSDVNVTPFFRHDSDEYLLADIVPEHIYLKDDFT